MREMSDGMLAALPAQLEMDGEHAYERDWLQQRDDIMHNLNAETEFRVRVRVRVRIMLGDGLKRREIQ